VSESNAFVWLCDQIETITNLSRLEARGTVRIALKELGLLPADLAPLQAAKVAEHVLPRELATRGVDDAVAICQRLSVEAKGLPDERSESAADEIFRDLAS
jgi:hypothetical protein